MDKVAVVIPNYNGYRYLETCFAALAKQTFTEFTTYFVDNGSQDESCAFLREHYPETKIIQLDDNYGFSRAVNEGIRQSKEPYVILLNNDTEVFQDFVERLYEGICKRKNAFACSAKLISYQERDKIDDAGNYYNMLGWAFARGKGKPVSEFETSDRIFAACAGAAIYRREFLEKTGLFDEEHFAYLEDTDIGYRARLLGYENWYEPSAKVYHVGDAASFEIRQKTLAHITEILNEKWGEDTVTLTITQQYRNMKEIIDTCPWLITLAEDACRACGVTPLILPIRGGTDGAQLSFMGLPCPNLGTGGHAYHGPYEHITVEGMDAAVDVTLEIIKLFSQRKG